MEHNDARHKLSEYLDGSITVEERAAIEAHLKTCSACSDALQELQKTVEHIKSVEEVEPPAWMTRKIMAKVRAGEEEKKSLLQRFFIPLSVKLPIQAVAVLFLAVTAFYIYRTIQPTPVPSEAPVQEFAVKNEALPAPTLRDKREVPKVTKDASVPAKKAPQAPEYKALDMKLEYEKPAPPVARGKAKAAMAEGGAENAVELTMKVSEFDAAGKEIETAVRVFGGTIVRTAPSTDQSGVIVSLNSNKFAELLSKLKTIGDVKEEVPAPIGREGYLTIRITMTKK